MHVPYVFEIFFIDLQCALHKKYRNKVSKNIFNKQRRDFMDGVLCHKNHVCMETIIWKCQEQQKVILDILQEKD